MLNVEALAQEMGFEVEDVMMLVTMFVESAQTSLEAIFEAIPTGDLNTLAQEAHSIKGSAANLQLEAISKLALIIESAAKNNLECDYQKVATALKTKIDALNEPAIS